MDLWLCSSSQAGTEAVAALCTEMLPGADRLPAGLIKPATGKIPRKLVKTQHFQR